MTPFQMEIRQVMRGYAKKGGKKIQSTTNRRLERLADFAATRGARESRPDRTENLYRFQKRVRLIRQDHRCL